VIHDLFRRLKPLYPEHIERLWIEYHLGDPDRQREINELLMVLAIKHLGMMVGEERLLLDPPPRDLIGRGDFLLGYTTYPGLPPSPIRIARDELLRHLFILGPTGTGKSTLLLGLLRQLLATVPVMIFDFKRNYRCLLADHRLVVFTVGRTAAPLRMNALRAPPGVPFDEWAGALADVICTSYLLLQGARNVLVSALLEAHRASDRATLRDARTIIESALFATRSGSRRYGWLESTSRTLDELTKGGFGDALNDADGTPLHALLAENVVFELHGFADDQKRCFCLLFLQAILLIRKNSTARRERLQHVLVFDEAHNVFPRERFGEQSVPARLAREVREYGEALIAATQQADVSESLIANSGFKFILRCDYPKDVQFAAQLLQIEPKWLPRLSLGNGIARFPVRYYLPLLFTFAEQPIKGVHVGDATVRQAWLASTLARLHTPTSEHARRTDAVPVCNEREQQLLRDVAEHPISTITARYERLGWNYKTGNAIKDSVIAKGFATFDPVVTPTGQVKILSLTDRARDLLEQAGVRVARSRHGGAEHEYWKFVIAERLRGQGFSVTDEYPVGGGKTVDLYAVRGERIVAAEVETGRSDIMANVAKCVGQDAEIVFVFTTPQVLAAHEAMIRAALPDARLLTTAEASALRW
jgi:hypothetical protein